MSSAQSSKLSTSCKREQISAAPSLAHTFGERGRACELMDLPKESHLLATRYVVGFSVGCNWRLQLLATGGFGGLATTASHAGGDDRAWRNLTFWPCMANLSCVTSSAALSPLDSRNVPTCLSTSSLLELRYKELNEFRARS